MQMFVASTVDFSALVSRFGFTKQFVATVNGNRCVTRQSLFDEWHGALRMPRNPDKNWDAFEDSLSEMFEWLGTTEIIIIVTFADRLMESVASAEKHWEVRQLLDILKKATGLFVDEPDRDDLARAGVFFVADHNCGADLVQLFLSAGFEIPEFK